MSPRTRSVAVALVTVFTLPSRMFWSGAEARQEPTDPRVIEVVAKRYAFDPAVIEVTEGERVRFMVRSADGVHGFQIKQFKIGKEIPRGTEPVVIDFTATSPGRFPILCSEYCGDGHDDMKGTLIVTARAAAP